MPYRRDVAVLAAPAVKATRQVNDRKQRRILLRLLRRRKASACLGTHQSCMVRCALQRDHAMNIPPWTAMCTLLTTLMRLALAAGLHAAVFGQSQRVHQVAKWACVQAQRNEHKIKRCCRSLIRRLWRDAFL